MTLTDTQQLVKERGMLATSFLESEFFQKFLLPTINQQRMDAYPKPDKDGWEKAYQYAYAKDEAYTELFTLIKNWGIEAKEMEKYERSEVDIITA